MKFCFRPFWTILLIASSSFSALINADTFTTTTYGTLYVDPYVGDTLEQFDPRLGTLTGVRFIAGYNYEANYLVKTFVVDPSLPHFIDFSVSFKAGLRIPFASDQTLRHIASIFVSGAESCNGEPSISSPTLVTSSCSENFPIDLSRFNPGVKSSDVYQRLINDNLLDMFIGTGNLHDLDLKLVGAGGGLYSPNISDSINISRDDTISINSFNRDNNEFYLGAKVSIIYTYNPRRKDSSK